MVVTVRVMPVTPDPHGAERSFPLPRRQRRPKETPRSVRGQAEYLPPRFELAGWLPGTGPRRRSELARALDERIAGDLLRIEDHVQLARARLVLHLEDTGDGHQRGLRRAVPRDGHG